MDFAEQNKISEEIQAALSNKLKGKTFRAAVAIVDENGEGFSFSVGNLTDKSSFEAWRVAVSGLTEEAEELATKFHLPVNTKLKKPMEPK